MINPVFKSLFDIHVVSKQSTSLFWWYILQQPNELKLHWRFNIYSELTFGSLNIFFGYDRLKFIKLTSFMMCVCVWERRREKDTHTRQVALCMICMHCHSLIRRINFAFVYTSQVAKKRLHLVFGGVGCNIGDLDHLCCYLIWHGFI